MRWIGWMVACLFDCLFEFLCYRVSFLLLLFFWGGGGGVNIVLAASCTGLWGLLWADFSWTNSEAWFIILRRKRTTHSLELCVVWHPLSYPHPLQKSNWGGGDPLNSVSGSIFHFIGNFRQMGLGTPHPLPQQKLFDGSLATSLSTLAHRG